MRLTWLRALLRAVLDDPAPGQEKTLKLKVRDLGGNCKTIELPEDAPIELP